MMVAMRKASCWETWGLTFGIVSLLQIVFKTQLFTALFQYYENLQGANHGHLALLRRLLAHFANIFEYVASTGHFVSAITSAHYHPNLT